MNREWTAFGDILMSPTVEVFAVFVLLAVVLWTILLNSRPARARQPQPVNLPQQSIGTFVSTGCPWRPTVIFTPKESNK